jgi:MFS superfamily sulfate permease-like transporter
VIGNLNYGFRAPSPPNLSQGSASSLISASLTITLLGFVETQLLNKKYSGMFGYTVSPNRELVALGLASIFGSFFGAYSAFGSIPRTKVAQVAGQKSNLANIVAAGVTLLAIVLILPVFANTPKAVTGSIIFCVATSLFEFEELKFAFRVRQWVDLILGIGMIGLTYFLGVDIGIFFAFTVCLLLAVKQTTLPGVAVLGRGYAEDDFHDFEDLDEETKEIEGVIIYKIDGPLYFANAEKLKDSTQRIDTWGGLHVHPSEQQVPLRLSSIVFDLSELKSVDASALSIFLEICHYYARQNRRVALVHLRRSVRKCFERAGIIEVVKPENVYRNIEQAVKMIQDDNLAKLQPAPSSRSPSYMSISPSQDRSLVHSPMTPLSPSLGSQSPIPSGAQTPRGKKSAMFAPPVVGSPLLRGIRKLPMK